MSSNPNKLESAVRAAVGKLAPSITKAGYDRAITYIGIWRALNSSNRRLYRSLEADAEMGGEVWRTRVDTLVKVVRRDLPSMARLISRHAAEPGKQT